MDADSGQLAMRRSIDDELHAAAHPCIPIAPLADATISGGSSGGAAINRAGALIGIVTQGSELDCRPGDTNRDGALTAEDVGCIAVGGSIGQLRPANYVWDLLGSTGNLQRLEESPSIPGTILSGPSKEQTADQSVEMHLITEVDWVFRLSDESSCATGAIYEVGTRLISGPSGEAGEYLPDGGGKTLIVPPNTILRTTGAYVEGGLFDYWPVEIVQVPRLPDRVYLEGSEVSLEIIVKAGTQGLIDERWVRPQDSQNSSGEVQCITSEPEDYRPMVVRHPPLCTP